MAYAREIKAEGQTLVSRVAGTNLIITVLPDGAVEISTQALGRRLTATGVAHNALSIREED